MGAREDRLDVRVAVPLRVAEGRVARHDAAEVGDDVAGDVGIGMLVYQDSRRRVRDVHEHRSVFPARGPHLLGHGGGDVHELLAFAGGDGNLAHRPLLLSR